MRSVSKDILVGVAVGDALGVPYEFISREEMDLGPAVGMVGHGSHMQVAGTWSDDSSLTLCLAESIAEGYSLSSTARKFIQWKRDCYWTAYDQVFDIGSTTARSIDQLQNFLVNGKYDELRLLKYGSVEQDNGNGSLMRILPLVHLTHGLAIEEQFQLVWENSALTHKHIRAGMCCMIYLRLAEHLLSGMDKIKAFHATQLDVQDLWRIINYSKDERQLLHRVIHMEIHEQERNTIQSDGYVVHSLEASLWSFLRTHSYQEAVLTAVNLGSDTDTNAAITGGLASLYYGTTSIPEDWLQPIAKLDAIYDLARKLDKRFAWL